MVKLRRGFLEVEDLQLHYRELPGAGPPLLVLAQCPASSAEWLITLPLLARSRRVVALDLPGLGDSEEFREPPLMPDYARVVAGALAALGAGPFDLLGHHTGAAVALAVAAQAPEQVRRLVFVGLPVYQRWQQRYRILGRAAPNDFDTTGEAVQQGWARTATLLREAGVAEAHLPDYTRLVWTARLQAGPYWFRPYVALAVWNEGRALLARVPHPTLIVAVTGDTLALEAEWQAEQLPAGRVASLSRGGSYPHLGNPTELAEVVDRFLREGSLP
ncbi:MAG: alpha/beta hydrolase fold protein [Dehalococcoidia bacterium]|nr:MAG: alpha/beta hydrolase fold protein [Dehalococcoidia bacterium]